MYQKCGRWVIGKTHREMRKYGDKGNATKLNFFAIRNTNDVQRVHSKTATIPNQKATRYIQIISITRSFN